jgi:catechol 2,3-dioxygenase-like lactoylglutathione lyase family enzyme
MNKTVDRVIIFNVAVIDMDKAKAFYTDRLGLKVSKDIGQGDMHWVILDLPGGGTSVALTTAYGDAKPGTMQMQFSTSDIQAAHKRLNTKSAKATTPIGDDLYGPGSGVKWFQLNDPDGDLLTVVQLVLTGA